MITIYKYPFKTVDSFSLALRKGYIIRKIEMQGVTPTMWVQVDTDAEEEHVEFAMVGTGHEIMFDLETHRFVDTYFEGPFVWHVFERIEYDVESS